MATAKQTQPPATTADLSAFLEGMGETWNPLDKGETKQSAGPQIKLHWDEDVLSLAADLRQTGDIIKKGLSAKVTAPAFDLPMFLPARAELTRAVRLPIMAPQDLSRLGNPIAIESRTALQRFCRSIILGEIGNGRLPENYIMAKGGRLPMLWFLSFVHKAPGLYLHTKALWRLTGGYTSVLGALAETSGRLAYVDARQRLALASGRTEVSPLLPGEAD